MVAPWGHPQLRHLLDGRLAQCSAQIPADLPEKQGKSGLRCRIILCLQSAKKDSRGLFEIMIINYKHHVLRPLVSFKRSFLFQPQPFLSKTKKALTSARPSLGLPTGQVVAAKSAAEINSCSVCTAAAAAESLRGETLSTSLPGMLC